jgi:hypothetical protein
VLSEQAQTVQKKDDDSGGNDDNDYLAAGTYSDFCLPRPMIFPNRISFCREI